MAIGTATAIIGSAVLGAGASLLGANRSASAARDATSAQTNAANQNLALQQYIYDDSRALQQPYYQAGLQGLYGQNGVMDLMGMSVPQAANSNAPQNAFASGTYGAQPAGGASKWDAYLQANPDVAQSAAQALQTPHLRNQGITTPQQYAEYHYNTYGRAEGRPMGPAQQAPAPNPAAPPASGQPQTNGGPRTGGTDGTGVDPRTQSLRDTPGYQFQMDEARRGVENSFASRGKLLSGGALTALQDRSQGIADNTYQQTLNNAFNLSNLGMGAAAQIGGAGQNYAAGAGNAYTNIGNAQANGAMGQANAFAGGLQGVSNAIGGGLGMWGAYNNWGAGGGGIGGTVTGPGTYVGGTYTNGWG